MRGVLASRDSSVFGVWAAPGARETIRKGEGRSPPPISKGFRAPGAARTPKIGPLKTPFTKPKNVCLMPLHGAKKSQKEAPLKRPWGAVAPQLYSWGSPEDPPPGWGAAAPQDPLEKHMGHTPGFSIDGYCVHNQTAGHESRRASPDQRLFRHNKCRKQHAFCVRQPRCEIAVTEQRSSLLQYSILQYSII
jgi:hypothetical protein